jgi:c-di-GMP-binding flagellar brake protein YcgR
MLEIKMILPVTMSSTLYVYGEVVDVRQREDFFQTAVKFMTIDDDIREQIVQFVFKAQRDILRHKKG